MTINDKTEIPLVEVQDLSKEFEKKCGLIDYVTGKKALKVRAVDDVAFDIKQGDTLGLVGESGCGKSTLGRCLLRLYEPTAGRLFFQGEDILQYSGAAQQKLYSQMQMIFQDPYSSLNPRMSVRQILMEVLKVHRICENKNEMEEKVDHFMNKVGLSKRLKNHLPNAFSGGQRQRISIARTLAVNPAFIVADEPTSALDVSIQAQILNLLMELQDEMHLTYLFISHDLNVVRYISRRIAVMYLGQIVEIAGADELFQNPLHPYSQALLAAVPIPDPEKKSTVEAISGDPPSPLEKIQGCKFHSRCGHARDICLRETPAMFSPAGDHFVRCFLHES